MAGPNTYPKRANAKPGRVSLRTPDFDHIIEDQGCRIRVTPAVVCPRRSGDEVEVGDSNHDLNCPLCFGSMVVDLPEQASELWGFIQGVKLERSFDQNSRFDIKDSMLTVPHGTRISYWFKIEVIDFGSMFNQMILRGSGDTDKLRYPTQELYDGSFYSTIDNDGTRFTKGVDYTIAGNVLTWTGSNRPDGAKLYSMLYPVAPTFRVLELVHENRYYYTDFKAPVKTPVQLPQQAHIRWDYLVSKGGSDVQNQ